MSGLAPVLNSQEVNIALEFYKIYNSSLQSSYYLKYCSSNLKKRNPWISLSLINKIKEKNKLFKRLKTHPNNIQLAFQYRQLSRECCYLIRQEKINYYSHKVRVNKGNSRMYWRIIRSILKNNEIKMKEVMINNNVIQVEGNEVLVANAFNNYFKDMPSQLINDSFGHDMYELPNMHRNEHDCTFNALSDTELVDVIWTMNNKRSVGPDGISMITIKRNLHSLLPALLHIINLSIRSGTYPDALKTSLIVPIHKNNDPKVLNNYRPITLQNSIAKIMENCVKRQLMKFIDEHSIFSKNQYGFVKFSGTDLAIERHITEIISNLDKSKPTISIYLDFTKAYDLINLNILLYKLEMYGIRGTSLNWFKTFLTNRKQIVIIQNIYSHEINVNIGIPQGGVLGPNLFILYINDMLKLNLNSKMFVFADDTSLLLSANNYKILYSRITQDLNEISHWMDINRLLINTKKSNAMIFSYKPSTVQMIKDSLQLKCHSHQCLYICNCDKIKIVDSVKYLGLHIDSDLCWRSHVEYIHRKLRQINYNIYHMRNYLASQDLRILYNSWFELTLRYGLIHWGGTFKEILKPIVTVQKLTLRTICNKGKYEPSLSLFNYLGVFNFKQLYVYSILSFVKKYYVLFPQIVIRRETRASDATVFF